jgi:hypothetical protein
MRDEKELLVKLIFAPWYLTCLFWGSVAKIAGLDRYQDEEGRQYNERMFQKAKEGLDPFE